MGRLLKSGFARERKKSEHCKCNILCQNGGLSEITLSLEGKKMDSSKMSCFPFISVMPSHYHCNLKCVSFLFQALAKSLQPEILIQFLSPQMFPALLSISSVLYCISDFHHFQNFAFEVDSGSIFR